MIQSTLFEIAEEPHAPGLLGAVGRCGCGVRIGKKTVKKDQFNWGAIISMERLVYQVLARRACI